MSYEFGLHLKQCGIVLQLTPLGTPRRNGVSEHRNHTLLDMVRSMLSLTDLPLSFWGHALETTSFTLKRAPSKSVEITLYELWFGKNLSCHFLKFADATLMSEGFSLISSNLNRRSASSYDTLGNYWIHLLP